jgi:hypothetical protein
LVSNAQASDAATAWLAVPAGAGTDACAEGTLAVPFGTEVAAGALAAEQAPSRSVRPVARRRVLRQSPVIMSRSPYVGVVAVRRWGAVVSAHGSRLRTIDPAADETLMAA